MAVAMKEGVGMGPLDKLLQESGSGGRGGRGSKGDKRLPKA